MKQLFSKILTSFLALIVVFSTFSFSVDGHYCGDKLVDFALFTQADVCSDQEKEQTPKSEQLEFSKIPCCKNITNIIEGEEIDLKVVNKSTLKQLFFVEAFIFSKYESLSKVAENLNYCNYTSPLFETNKVVLFENFRI